MHHQCCCNEDHLCFQTFNWDQYLGKNYSLFSLQSVMKKLQITNEGTNALIRESSSENLGRLFEGNKEGHYVKDVKDM